MVLGSKSGHEDDAKKRKVRVEARVDQARKHRRSQGHELSPWQVAMVSTIAEIDPRHEPAYAKELSSIVAAISQNGVWRTYVEWRISTSFDSAIERKTQAGRDFYRVSVECDGQKLSCQCPSVEKAFAFLHLYQKLIVEQFYSIGPPWADGKVFEA